jgi:hypothetical protein
MTKWHKKGKYQRTAASLFHTIVVVLDNEYGALLRHVYKFFWRVAPGSGKSADRFLHHETPLLQNRGDETGHFKN